MSAPLRPDEARISTRPTDGSRGIAVSPHYLASRAGVDVLNHGGNAVDAAIAVNAVLGVVLPDTCGPGGDLFALIHKPGDTEPTALNASGRAGSGVTADDMRDAGLGSLPGTAAEILDDRVRIHLCPDKITTAEWADVMMIAHELGFRSTATVMFGHIDDPAAWANHLEVVRTIQRRTGGFTEFVPLPFVHMGAPIYLQGNSRMGPTWDEVVLMHAVARIAFDGLIPNVQASWVKLGLDGARRLLDAGCNDLGGTLMGEAITRSAGASHGQEMTVGQFEDLIRSAGRVPSRRTTLYEMLPGLSALAGRSE